MERLLCWGWKPVSAWRRSRNSMSCPARQTRTPATFLLPDFDTFPCVTNCKCRCFGRGQLPAGTVRESIILLDDSLLVSSDEPLTKFVPFLKKNSYRLVLVGTDIKSIVARSDIELSVIQEFCDGSTQGTFPVGSFPEGVAFDRANIWITSFSSNNVTKLALNGTVLGTFALGLGP
jgi:hypothetical protein